MHNPL